MKTTAKIILLTAVTVSLFFASWYVAHGDIYFPADIGRDFHILEEIRQKKIILIGPRSSGGLFHGPLWPYLNFPAYAIGRGNPIIVGWFWILLIGIFVISCYEIARRLFTTATAMLFTAMTSLYMGFHARGLFNPHGAMMVLPGFYFALIRYGQTVDIRYLILLLALGAAMTQFQLAIGIPFLLLAAVPVGYAIWKKRKFSHILSVLLLPVFLGNFIIFNVRHDAFFTRQIGAFISPTQNGEPFNYLAWVPERLWLMISSMEILHVDPGLRNLFLFGLVIVLICLQIADKRYRREYVTFLYLYVGFFVLSLVDKGPMVYFYLFPLFPLVFLIFCSLVESRAKYVFLVVFFVVNAFNVSAAFGDIKDSKAFIGNDEDSWKFLSTLSESVFREAPEEFGYFVFAPDVFAYEPKYAMKYAASRSPKRAWYFQKKPVTYLIMAPPPRWDPYMTGQWWKINQIKIAPPADSVTTYPNGYRVEKVFLTSADQAVAFDPAVDPAMHFR